MIKGSITPVVIGKLQYTEKLEKCLNDIHNGLMAHDADPVLAIYGERSLSLAIAQIGRAHV